MNKNLNFLWFRKNLSLIAVLGLLWVTIIVLYIFSLNLNHNYFGYILDDAYIHMAMAKNFVQYGVWGVTKYGFSSSTSSILWVLLLSLVYKLFGVNDISPLLLNVIFASAVVMVIYYFFKKCHFPQWYSFLVLMLIVFLTPIPTLIFTGMEHNLQILFLIPFVYIAARLLPKEEINNRDYKILLIMGVILTLLRYESLILIFIVSFLFLLKKKYYHAVILAGLSLIPVIIYGFISVANGWYFLPNPLIVKSVLADFSIYNFDWIFKFLKLTLYNMEIYTYLILFIFICTLIFLRIYNKKGNLWSFESILLIIFILLSVTNLLFVLKDILHYFFWYFRYDAYLVVLGFFILSINLRKYLPKKIPEFQRNLIPRYLAIILLIILFLSTFSARGYSMTEIPQASNNIHEQQYQMANFLKDYYTGQSVMLNDIGEISYISNVKMLDFINLGSIDFLKNNGKDKHDVIRDKDVKIMIVYDDGLKPGLVNYIKVAEWTIPNNVVCGDETVAFYATSQEEAQKLLKNLKEFSQKLPGDVKVTYYI